MAEDQKEENKEATDDNIRKIFEGIGFAKVEDKYNVTIQYDSSSELLTLSFTNQVTKGVYKQSFDKQNIKQITSKYNLEPLLLTKMIIDTLGSKDKTAQNLRVFIFPNLKQGIICTCTYSL